MNELMKTLNITLPSINLDESDLSKYQQAIDAKAEEVRQHNVTTEGLNDDKKYRAYIKKQIDGTDSNRKDITNQIMGVKKQITDTVNNMLLPLVEAHKELDNKIKAIEEVERNEKRLRIYHQIIEPTYLARGLDPHKAVIDETWLNKTTGYKKILDGVVEYANILEQATKRKGSVVGPHGFIINSYGEKTSIKARKAVITYYGDEQASNTIETELKKLDSNASVIDIEFD